MKRKILFGIMALVVSTQVQAGQQVQADSESSNLWGKVKHFLGMDSNQGVVADQKPDQQAEQAINPAEDQMEKHKVMPLDQALNATQGGTNRGEGIMEEHKVMPVDQDLNKPQGETPHPGEGIMEEHKVMPLDQALNATQGGTNRVEGPPMAADQEMGEQNHFENSQGGFYYDVPSPDELDQDADQGGLPPDHVVIGGYWGFTPGGQQPNGDAGLNGLLPFGKESQADDQASENQKEPPQGFLEEGSGRVGEEAL
jgi:hypothetical protein